MLIISGSKHNEMWNFIQVKLYNNSLFVTRSLILGYCGIDAKRGATK
jgi:hypothetical protein